MTGLALRLAWRELRGGLRGLRVFLLALALGVGAIAAVGSLTAAVDAGLGADARTLLGGDVELHRVHRPVSAAVRAYLAGAGTLSETVEMRAMARLPAEPPDKAGTPPLLVELKAVDRAYPLYGAVGLRPAQSLEEALAFRDGAFGAAVDGEVLRRLGLAPGARLRIGEAVFRVRAALVHEPDRGARVFALGPRVMIAARALAATGLLRPGSLVYYNDRVRLSPDTDVGAFVARLKAAFPHAPWRVRTAAEAAPGLRHFVDHLSVYLTLVGLTTLLVGGVGVAGGVKNYLDERRETVATFKCLGAPAALVFRIYLAQVFTLAAAGIAAGLAMGAAAPALVAPALAAWSATGGPEVPLRLALYPVPLAAAAAFGMLTALVFSLWPLARARDIPGAALFRSMVARAPWRPRAADVAGAGAALAALSGLAVLTVANRHLALWFVAGAAASVIVFFALGRALVWTARRAGRGAGGRPGLRLALANLARPDGPAAGVVLAMGLGLTVLVAVALVQGNLLRQVTENLPARAPAYFFIDIQPQQAAAFDAALAAVPGVEEVRRAPSLRGRIVRLNGVPVDKAAVAPGAAWAVANERGLTYAARPPAGTRLVAGAWWPPDYRGPPLVSLDADMARGLGLRVGDTITVDVLGRDITARVASLRTIDWTSLAINFTIVFAPGTLEAAPQTYIATVRTAPGAELMALDAVTARFANVSAIRVKEALDAAARILRRIGLAVRLSAGATVAAGLLVLGGAVAAGHRRRVYDSVVLKVLGATRGDLLRAYLMEFGLLGLATASVAAAAGTGTAWFVVARIMRAPWLFLPDAALATAALGILAALVLGFWGTWRALGRKAAPVLRNE